VNRCLALVCVLGGLGAGPLTAQGPFLFEDVTESTGIAFRHQDGSSGQYYIAECMCAGLALFDYDNDQDIDLYFLNGGALRGTDFSVPPRNALYRNDGNWRFTDVTGASGLGDTGHALGVAVGDMDNDGDQDVYITNFGPNVLYRNNGDGSFTDVTAQAGVADGDSFGAGANFLDMDGDGDLDLFSASYVDFSYDNHDARKLMGYPVYAGPRSYRSTPDSLFRNNGDGSFTDVSRSSGIAALPGTGMGTVCCDFDSDGDTDIFVANDLMQNFLWQNNGQGLFQEVGLLLGVACNANGEDTGSMGIGCADYNNDGWLDFYVTAYQDQTPSLYQNIEGMMFEDVTNRTGTGANTRHMVHWGNDFVDFDNDGDRDLFVSMGHLQDNIEHWDKRSSWVKPNLIFANQGNASFASVTDSSGPGLGVALSSRGVGFDDLDNDGDVDIVILNSRARPTILRNDSPSQGHWLQIRLQGRGSNRDGVGARVRVKVGNLILVDEVHSGRGYQSHYGMRLYFGLGRNDRIDQVAVHWIGGRTETFACDRVDQRLTLLEGAGTTVTE